MRRFLVLLALLFALLMPGCRSAGDITLLVASEDAAHVGVRVYLEVRDDADQRRAITSAWLQQSSVELKLHDVLDGRRYQARWWVDLDRDGTPSAPASGAEPLFEHALTGTSDLGLFYPRSSWEISRAVVPPVIPPFCSGECGPESNSSCSAGNICVYFASVMQWTCCIHNPIDQGRVP